MSDDEGAKLIAKVHELVGEKKGDEAILAAGKAYQEFGQGLRAYVTTALTDFQKRMTETLGQGKEASKITNHLGTQLASKCCCILLAEAAELSTGTRQSISDFVGHAAEHYEQSKEEHTHRMMSSLLHTVLAPIEDEMTKQAAEAHSPGN